MLKGGFALVILIMCSWCVQAQIEHAPNDTILLGAVIVGNDTIPVVFLDNFEVHALMPRALARQRKNQHDDLAALRYNVYKVYPYAVTASEVLKDVDKNLDALPDKAARKKYLKTVDAELNSRFKGELKDLTIEQGHILIRLIDRQTGKPCFAIISQLKGSFSAIIWQSVGLIFGNNLKREYDAEDKDRDIEMVVRELEQNNLYNYQYQQQQYRLRHPSNH